MNESEIFQTRAPCCSSEESPAGPVREAAVVRRRGKWKGLASAFEVEGLGDLNTHTTTFRLSEK